ncbi:hypothetical protein FVEN_g12035 [Fusarium venenatum]|uniref:Uncharacterized protein n=1 Tax=Fusarium venenatum TaxID=56646 RepID=A0A2L2SZF5_9HYPO|nr:uncharacterized protein FVRRES_06775 [Fusarium venenatum]KAG8349756.1 hypothetical protein FVEN_g12035 [Fusarium venenatum]KAH6993745.1 hypothetical protein EDB82DRAFT_499820 [Fusarium venenatum]CEI62339.1 unnamed protein product [Fusarium venenatum]
MSPFDHKRTNYRKIPWGLHGRRISDSIQDWTFDTGIEMQDIPLSSPEISGKQKSSSSSISDPQFDTLMAECATVRDRMEKIEDKIAELYYARQKNGDIVSSASSDANTSASQKRSTDKGNLTVGTQQKSPSTEFYDCEDYSHFEQVEERVENRKVKKPKTEEEKNRHINMVFIRENL